MNVCFIIPIHEPDFKYVKNILLTKEQFKIETDIYFIMSNLQQEKKLKKLCKEITSVNTIVIPDENVIHQLLHQCRPRGPAVYKKLYGMLELLNKYQYYCCVDSEITFIKHVNIFNLCEKYYNKKLIYANRTRMMFHTKLPLQFYNEDDQRKIKKETNDLNFWSWFNNIPIYKNDCLISFFDYIHLNKNTLPKFMNKFNSPFERIIYEYYLILHYNFKVKLLDIDLTPGTDESIVERGHLHSVDIINEINPYWFPSRGWFGKENKMLNKDDIFIIFHLDRCKKNMKNIKL